ncbi:uncharacterized protein LOC100201163 [Hydra vulgaris]|uniref:Large ribosomal subunit protein eL14 n=1 Tax=Hydra vulgaris TaxID=6087 RepID=A0ABM4DNX0_HYDVU
MVYTRFVEAGRVALVNLGKYEGKLVVICDIVDLKRGIVENPVNGIPRQVMRFKDLSLTDLKIDIPLGARSGAVRKQYEKSEINAKWDKTAWCAKLKNRIAKSNLNDFDRFKSKNAKQNKNRKIKAVLKLMKADARKK